MPGELSGEPTKRRLKVRDKLIFPVVPAHAPRLEMKTANPTQRPTDFRRRIAHQTDPLDPATQRLPDSKAGQAGMHHGGRPGVGIKANRQMRRKRAGQPVCAIDSQASPDGGKTAAVVNQGQIGRRGKTRQAADFNLEASQARCTQGQALGMHQPRAEIIGIARLAAGKTADVERDMRLTAISIEQQTIKLRRGTIDPLSHNGRIEIDRPEQIGRAPEMPFDKVTAFAGQGKGLLKQSHGGEMIVSSG